MSFFLFGITTQCHFIAVGFHRKWRFLISSLLWDCVGSPTIPPKRVLCVQMSCDPHYRVLKNEIRARSKVPDDCRTHGGLTLFSGESENDEQRG